MHDCAWIVALVAGLGALSVGCGGDSTDPTGSGSGSGAGGPGPTTNGCTIFPSDNWWNTPVDDAPLDANSDGYIAFINQNGGDGPLHADFDSIGDGIPFAYVDGSTAKVSVKFTYGDESDKGPYPIPDSPPIEDGGDRHVILVETDTCTLYELYAAEDQGGAWHAGSGAIFDLSTNDLRPDCWTSADAAGLPIYPGLVRFDEVKAGAIEHALRFTVDQSGAAWLKPARHQASGETDPDAPPMGLRLRLKKSDHVSQVLAKAGAQPKVVMTALQRYGMIVADNGSNWYVSGEPNKAWDDDAFHGAFDDLTGDDFEVVDTGEKLEHQSMCH